MSAASSLLAQLSDSLVELVAGSRDYVAAIDIPGGDVLTGIAWTSDALVVSEQALPDAAEFDVRVGEHRHRARLAGRDEGTNVAVLKLMDGSLAPALPAHAVARTGALAVLIGATAQDVSARLALIRATGDSWDSLAGGQIDHKIILDCRIGREEGGPVLAADGKLFGMATRGARGRSLVIPASTVDCSVSVLLRTGSVPRGWLGIALRLVALPDTLRPGDGQRTGLMVMDVAANSPGATAGVLPGDILLSAGGVAANRFGSITRQLGPTSIGSTIELVIARAGATLSRQITIAGRPAS